MSDLRETPELDKRPRPPVVREVRPPTIIESRPRRGFRWFGWGAVLVGVAVLATAAAVLIMRGGDEEPIAQPSVGEAGIFDFEWDPFHTLGQYTPPVNPGDWDPFHTLGQYTPPVANQPATLAVGEWDPFHTLGQYTPPEIPAA